MPYGELPKLKNTSGDDIEGIPVVIQNPRKTAFLRFPTSTELVEYMNAQKSLYRDLGRRKGKSEDVPSPKADLKLFTALRLDKAGVEFDEAEALYALNQINDTRLTNCARQGDSFVITLATRFGEVTHTLDIPLQRDLMKYQNDRFDELNLPHGLTERRFPIQPAIELYAKMNPKSDGYADGFEPPPHHKRAAVIEVITALDTLDTLSDPN